MNKKTMGRCAEDAACEYLKSMGCTILFRNWYASCGELDIIAGKNDTIHIVEVRCRKNGAVVSALESVNHTKLVNLQKAAEEFLYVHNYLDFYVSVDVIACICDNDRISVIGWYENITG